MAELATYDYLALGRLLRPRLVADGRGWRALAAEIGVTSPDLSRICAGQTVGSQKVYAVCDWLGIDDRRYYLPPAAPSVFHGERTETVATIPETGIATTSEGQRK